MSGGRLNVMQLTDVTGRGGAEKALVDLALHLDRRRFNVSVCATRHAGNYQPILDEAGVPTLDLHRERRWDLYKLAGLVHVLRRRPVHILHTHLFGSNTWGRILGALAGVPVIIAHEHWSSKASREVVVDRLLYRLGDAIIVPSEASKRLVMAREHLPAAALHVVYNGVDPAPFAGGEGRAAIREEWGVPPDVVLAGCVGRLSADKGGQDVLLEAVARLRATHPALRLVYVGEGPLRAGLEAQAAARGLDSAVLFVGQRRDVPRLLRALDVFILPSLREAFPIAVLEAMAAARPVIATDVGGVPEVVQAGETGLLVPPNDVAALTEALGRLVTDPGLAARLGRAGQARVHAEFTIDRMVDRVEALYTALAGARLRGHAGGR